MLTTEGALTCSYDLLEELKANLALQEVAGSLQGSALCGLHLARFGVYPE